MDSVAERLDRQSIAQIGQATDPVLHVPASRARVPSSASPVTPAAIIKVSHRDAGSG
jgi:hypothetical protein